MSNSGQICIAVKRVYVHEDQYDEFCDILAELADKAKFGDGMAKETECVMPVRASHVFMRTHVCVWGGGGQRRVYGMCVCVCVCARACACVSLGPRRF